MFLLIDPIDTPNRATTDQYQLWVSSFSPMGGKDDAL